MSLCWFFYLVSLSGEQIICLLHVPPLCDALLRLCLVCRSLLLSQSMWKLYIFDLFRKIIPRGMKSLEPWFRSSPIRTTSNWLTSLVECRVFWFTSNSSKPYQSVVVYLPLSHRGGEPNQSVVIYLPLSFRGGEPNQSVVIYSPLPRR